MEKLKLAKELFTRPLTLEELHKLDQLERQAKRPRKSSISLLYGMPPTPLLNQQYSTKPVKQGYSSHNPYGSSCKGKGLAVFPLLLVISLNSFEIPQLLFTSLLLHT